MERPFADGRAVAWTAGRTLTASLSKSGSSKGSAIGGRALRDAVEPPRDDDDSDAEVPMEAAEPLPPRDVEDFPPRWEALAAGSDCTTAPLGKRETSRSLRDGVAGGAARLATTRLTSSVIVTPEAVVCVCVAASPPAACSTRQEHGRKNDTWGQGWRGTGSARQEGRQVRTHALGEKQTREQKKCRERTGKTRAPVATATHRIAHTPAPRYTGTITRQSRLREQRRADGFAGDAAAAIASRCGRGSGSCGRCRATPATG